LDSQTKATSGSLQLMQRLWQQYRPKLCIMVFSIHNLILYM